MNGIYDDRWKVVPLKELEQYRHYICPHCGKDFNVLHFGTIAGVETAGAFCGCGWRPYGHPGMERDGDH